MACVPLGEWRRPLFCFHLLLTGSTPPSRPANASTRGRSSALCLLLLLHLERGDIHLLWGAPCPGALGMVLGTMPCCCLCCRRISPTLPDSALQWAPVCRMPGISTSIPAWQTWHPTDGQRSGAGLRMAGDSSLRRCVGSRAVLPSGDGCFMF
jgi:hypothetical protein